jgi:proton glutamate symport protein
LRGKINFLMNQKSSLWLAVGSVAVVALLHFIPSLSPTVLFGARWAAVAALLWYGYQAKALTTWIFVSMFVGLAIGYDFPAIGTNLEVFSKIFIQLIKTIIAPLLFGTLVIAIAGQTNTAQVGRMSVKAFSYFLGATSIALVVGLVAINITKAGILPETVRERVQTNKNTTVSADQLSILLPDSTKNDYKLQYQGRNLSPIAEPVKQDWKKIVLHTFPENVAKMIYEGAVLQVVVFSLFFGFALRQVSERHRKTMLDWCESLTEIMFKFTGLIMYFAPFAVGGAMAFTVGKMGLEALQPLLKLLGTLYIALIVFVLLVFLPVMLFFRIPIKKFFTAIYEPAALAFATASSESALPKAMTVMENFGVPRKIVSFVLPTGYSFNLDGSTLYLSLASVFCAQAAGMELTWQFQLAMMASLLLTSKGVAGVPRATFVILTATLAQFHIPEWPTALILGIDALMDMGRTCVNLIGNCLASAVVARWEGELED